MENLEKLAGRPWRIAIVMSLLALLAACGSGDDDDDFVLDTEVARVDITPQNLVLTEIGEQQRLHAQAYNAADEPIDADIEWTSSNPANVGVDASGLLTAFNLGSAVISASAGGVESPPALMIVATPAAGALLVRDRQVVEAPAAVDPNGSYRAGTEYTVVLSGIDSPRVGDIVMGLESVPLAGRVTQVEAPPGGAGVKLKLAVVPVNELFEDLVIDEVIDLTRAEFEVADQAGEYYTMQVRGDGRYSFTARDDTPTSENRPGIAGRGTAARAIGTVANPYYPFDCEFTGAVGMNLALLSPSIELEHDLSLPIAYDSGTGGLSKVALKGQVKGTFKIKNQLTAALEGKASCKLQLLEINIPMPGPLAAVLGAQIPVGIGFELGGKVTLADVGLTLEASAQLEQEFGVIRQTPGDWELTGSLDSSGDAKIGFDMPPTTLTDDIKIEPSMGGFGFANLTFGNPLFSSLRLTLAEMQGGASQEANLALVETQVGNAGYKSDYKLTEGFVARPGGDLADLLGLLGVPAIAAVEFKLTEVLTTSPASVSLNSNLSDFLAGDQVRFSIELDSTTVNYFPLVYNVDEVRIYRRTDFAGQVGAELIASQQASEGQTHFDLEWLADSNGSVAGQFLAFVTTRLLPLPLLDALELGTVNAGSSNTARVSHGRLNIEPWAETILGTPDEPGRIIDVPADSISVSSVGSSTISGSDASIDERASATVVWSEEFEENSQSITRFSYRFDGRASAVVGGSIEGSSVHGEARVGDNTYLAFQVNEPVNIRLSGRGSGNIGTADPFAYSPVSISVRVSDEFTLPEPYSVGVTFSDQGPILLPIDFEAELQPGRYVVQMIPTVEADSADIDTPGSSSAIAEGSLEVLVEFF